jgi:hypothetical protein
MSIGHAYCKSQDWYLLPPPAKFAVRTRPWWAFFTTELTNLCLQQVIVRFIFLSKGLDEVVVVVVVVV